MLKSVSNRNSVSGCLADCPADNHACQLAQFLYGTLCVICKKPKTKRKVSWINKIFRTKRNTDTVEKIPTRKIDFTQITTYWNADPVAPEIELYVDGMDLIMDIYLNHFQFEQYKKGDKAKIRFKNCAKYSLNTCNDEGFYYGQYRIKPTELEWGEFYEIKNGLDRNMPNPIVKISNDSSDKRHFIFFFKDETFESLASEYELEFYNETEN